MLKDCVVLENCTRIYCLRTDVCKEILSVSLYSWLIALMALRRANQEIWSAAVR